MRESELRSHATCSICHRKVGSSGLPVFWSVEARSYVLDFSAIQRRDGLAAMLGGSAVIASALGRDEEMAIMTHSTEMTVCHPCMLSVDARYSINAAIDRADNGSDEETSREE